MMFGTLIISAFLAIGVATANEWHEKKIDHDKVQPYAQREPTTDIERVAIRLRPQLTVSNSCLPYPAVNDAGETSGGLKASGPPTGECEWSELGSQIYARAGEINGLYAIMYMWYFPKTEKHKHDFRTVVLFIKDVQLEVPSIRGCSLSAPTLRGFTNYAPCPAENIVDHTIQIMYKHIDKDDNILSLKNDQDEFTEVSLENALEPFQDLVMWDHMSEFARKALNSSVFDGARVDINDLHFEKNLKRAWSFTNEYDNDFLH